MGSVARFICIIVISIIMFIQFHNRNVELRILEKYLSRKGFDLLIIYGRRRVGKTALILKATKNMERIYFVATEKNNLRGFYRKCMSIFPEVTKLKEDWEVIFEYLKDKVDVIIIDEFQNMIKEDKAIISIFQRIVDTILQDSNTNLVLLGSTVSIMTSKVLSYESPLYGRKTLSMKLEPIGFVHLKKFFPGKSMEELVEIYGFADGIPHYLIKINPNIYFWEWLQNELEEKAFIIDEVDFLMRYEFEEVGTYKAILQAMAYGKAKINEIKDFTGLKRTDISPYLKNLIETGFIRREVPLLEKPKSKKGRYFIADNFLTFWFRYIHPNLSSIEEGIFSAETIKHTYRSYLGYVFEKICRQIVVNLIKSNYLPRFTKIGKQWGKVPKTKEAYEIDIVALNEHTMEILFAECKWKENVNAEEVCRDLIEKAGHVNWHNEERREHLAVFAKSFSSRVEEFEGRQVFCFDLKDIEKLINTNSN